VIRPSTEPDEDAVVGVWLASTIPGQPFLSEETWRAMEPEIRELLGRADTWVVEHDGTIVAFCSMLDLIGGLFTHPDHQGKGHGAALVEHVRNRHEPLFVEVFEANRRAIDFYRGRGFVEDERRFDEGTGLPMWIMRMP
jgi:putative acetyltransferase